jgi:hypothetical protein
VLIYVRGDINEVSIYEELHEGSEPMQGVWCHVRDNFDSPLQLDIIGMKYRVRLPLFSHIARVPKHGECLSEQIKQRNFWEGRTFQHFPSGKCDEDQDLAKVELIALIPSFAAIQFNLVDQVLLPIHLESFYTFLG